MSENDKRKAEESVLEKIYKKIRKLEDHYYNLKKSASAEKTPQDGPGPSTKDDEIQKDPPNLVDRMKLFDKDCSNNESERQGSSDSDQDSVHSESINEEALQILGEDPSLCAPKDAIIHPDLASRWKAWIVSGLDKEGRAELLKNYPRGGKCPLEPPILNPEFVSSLNETAVKRDKHFIDSQCLIGSAMSALGSAITLLLNEKKEGVDRNEFLRRMCDSGKLLVDLHHKESVARKAYILPGLDKKAKTLLGRTETDKYLFGEDLSEKLKTAKAVEKAGLDLKLQSAKPIPGKTPGAFKKNNPVNWKSPLARFQRTNQADNNQRGPNTYKSRRGRSQQENCYVQTGE